MIVALDATPLTVPTGGIRRYVEELSRTLRELYPEDRYLLLSDQLTPPGNWWHRRWWLNGLRAALLEAKADLFHGTDFAVPYRRACPAVMTIHDLSPWRFPTPSHRVRQRVPWLLRTRRARHVITPSEAIRQEVIHHFGLAPASVHAIPLAPALLSRERHPAAGARPYLLTVGALEPRKNLTQAIEAWRAFRSSLDLVVVGRDQGAARPQEDGVHFKGAVTDEELVGLYAHATAFLYPSLYEGFGLPILEAMQCGTPVVISRDPACRETAGGAALVADGTREWIAAIEAASTRREELQQAGFRRAAEFSWERTARMHHEVYEHALRSR